MRIRTIVVDDEKPARDRVKRFLAEHPDFELAGEAGDGASAVRLIEDTRPDVVILDVQMPEMDGFEVLRRLSFAPRVVFATAFDRYAVRAFEVASLDFLLKPFDRKRFAAALGRVREEIRRSLPAEKKLDALLQEIRESTDALRAAAGTGAAAEPREGAQEGEDEAPESARGGRASASPGRPFAERISGRRGSRISLLAPSEVLWFEAEGEIVLARAGPHRYIVSRTLAELEATLDPAQFFRCHRSFLVNLSAITEIVPEDSGNYRILVRSQDRATIPLSRRQARRLREVFPW